MLDMHLLNHIVQASHDQANVRELCILRVRQTAGLILLFVTARSPGDVVSTGHQRNTARSSDQIVQQVRRIVLFDN